MLSYIIAYFRIYVLKNHGQFDKNGILEAPSEIIVGKVQYFVQILIIGFTFNHFFQKDFEVTLAGLWIAIDIIILIFKQA